MMKEDSDRERKKENLPLTKKHATFGSYGSKKDCLTCWNLMSRSKVIGSLGLQTGGRVYSIFWAVVQGISFTV